MKHLRFLEVATNALSELPYSMEEMSDLERLDVSGNSLKELPKSLGNLRLLESKKVKRAKSGLSAINNPFPKPLSEFVKLSQPRATIEILRYLRGESTFEDKTLELENDKTLKEIAAPSIPKQGAGIRFSTAKNKKIVFADPRRDIGDDFLALEALLPELISATKLFLVGIRGGNAYGELEEIAEKYLELISMPIDQINSGRVWAVGLRLESWASSVQRNIQNGFLPELENNQKAALDSLLGLHAPFIMSTRTGRVMFERSSEYHRNEVEDEGFRKVSNLLVNVIRNSSLLISSEVIEEVSQINSAIGIGPRPERFIVAAKTTDQNLLATIAKNAIGFFAATSFAGVLGQSQMFQGTLHQIGGGLDQSILFFVNNYDDLKLFAAGAGQEMAWLGRFMSWLKIKIGWS
tara:strand:+ start:5385 stop:6605 length:1221 start_codon:yes stop_codon:yes gene_type:complete